MPELNEKRLGHEISKKPPFGCFIWHRCEDCGKERWVSFIHNTNSPRATICWACARARSKGTKGKGFLDKDGYNRISLPWSHPYIKTADSRGWILEHRLVMAEHLGRNIKSAEHIHHLNGNKKDNRIENLKLMSKRDHLDRHKGKPYVERIRQLEARIELLEIEIDRLKSIHLSSMSFHASNDPIISDMPPASSEFSFSLSAEDSSLSK